MKSSERQLSALRINRSRGLLWGTKNLRINRGFFVWLKTITIYKIMRSCGEQRNSSVIYETKYYAIFLIDSYAPMLALLGCELFRVQ